MDEMGELYREETGVRVDFSYSGAAILLANLVFSRTGDLFMPGEMFYLKQAATRGYVADARPVAYFVPVMIVRKGNPKNIQSLSDLARPEMTVGVGDPEALPVGPITQGIFERAGLTEAIEPNITIKAGCIPELANAVKLKALDAAIVWDAVAYYYADSVDIIEIPTEINEYALVPIGVLTSAGERTEQARRFMEFLVSEDAKAVFEEHHFRTTVPRGVKPACLGRSCDGLAQ
jgi:molybdate transport system substrate-binding protein